MGLPVALAMTNPLFVLYDAGAIARAVVGAASEGTVAAIPTSHTDTSPVLALPVLLASEGRKYT